MMTQEGEPGGAPQMKFSCRTCAHRKVKCDRTYPVCTQCSKNRVACVYKAPPPPRRRQKGIRGIDLTTRLRIYEETLEKLGVDPEALVRDGVVTSSVPAPHGCSSNKDDPHQEYEAGVLVAGNGKSRYLENGIWTSLQSEFRETKEILEEETTDEDSTPQEEGPQDIAILNGEALIFGHRSPSTKLSQLHPAPWQLFKIWQYYLENVNPLVKLFHAPTVQQIISDASGHLDDLPRNIEALLFGVYCMTIGSLSDGDCIALLAVPKREAVQRYRTAAQYALSNANLLKTSDVMVLQAFTLYVTSLQNYDARVLWHLAGIASRIAQRLGLHRDGEKLSLSPFDTEIRRRLWWQIMMNEGFSQKLAGTGTANAVLMGDVKMPLSINDSDLFPGMKEPPKEHDGATEMMFFLIRTHVGMFLQKSASVHTAFDGVWHRMSTSNVSLTVKDREIDDLERTFEQKFLQHCDPAITWHFMCIQLGKTIIKMMRFLAHSADYRRGETTQLQKDDLFDLALSVISAQNLAYTMKNMQGFMWHVNLHFQWKAFILLVGELRHRTHGPQVDKAWKEIQLAYDFHPDFDEELSRRALPIAMSNLTLKAWTSFVFARGVPDGGEPYFIQLIRNKNDRAMSGRPFKSPQIGSTQFVPHSDLEASRGQTASHLTQMVDWNDPTMIEDSTISIENLDNSFLGDPQSFDWSAWDSLVTDFRTGQNNLIDTDLSMFDLTLN